jgi:hypothetical protein
MHAHIEWEATDCDGRLSGSHAMLMTEEETAADFGDIDFQHRVLSSVVNVGARRGTLTVEETEDGTPSLSWSETTEEGSRYVEATFYVNENHCPESAHKTPRRDHRAESAGY